MVFLGMSQECIGFSQDLLRFLSGCPKMFSGSSGDLSQGPRDMS